mgnify:CR=1 FL=1
MSTKKLVTPLSEEAVRGLRAGDKVSLSGVVYAARDAAHARLVSLIREGKPLPFDLRGQVIYYVGPSPARPGRVIGSAGPTTSERMDPYTPALLAQGLKGMIGKGSRAPEVREALARYGAVYLAAVGGAAALIARTIKASRVVAYEELGPEAIRELTVEDFPAIVVNDVYGNDLYEEGVKKYRRG